MPEVLQFTRPLRDVRLRSPELDRERACQAREQEILERGRREGEKALSEQLLRQRSELLELQQGLFRSLRELMPQIVRETEDLLVALAVEAAQKVVAGLPVSEELVAEVVREALARAEETRELTIRLNPADLELLERVNSPLLATELGGDRIRLEPAGDVTRGGCMVQTRFGTIDARRETKLELIKKSLEA